MHSLVFLFNVKDVCHFVSMKCLSAYALKLSCSFVYLEPPMDTLTVKSETNFCPIEKMTTFIIRGLPLATPKY